MKNDGTKPTAVAGPVLSEGLGPLVERIGSPPDTHCWDDDSAADCWSYSPQLVAELLDAERERWRAAAQKAEDALTWANGGEPLPTLEREALDLLRPLLRA